MADAKNQVTKLEKKLAEKREDVAEVQANLGEAKAIGDTKKIVKYQKKLTDKQADLRQIQQELSQARAELSALQK